jgi:transposase-like protein
MDLLNSCETWEYPPGPSLNSLIRELLNLEHDRQGMSREVEKRETAASIVAHYPEVGTRELAKAIKVNASTISRWRRSSEFKELTAKKTETSTSSAQTGEKLETFANEGPLQKEVLSLLLATASKLYGPRKEKQLPQDY